MLTTKYPEISVQLAKTRCDASNAFAIIGRVSKALRRANVPDVEVKAFVAEATSGNYDHVLQTVMKWVEVW